ncbi:MAG: transposase [Armatimonadetes bacterium]|nr:transposase [Armatimonadota bacterium]
MDEQIVRILQQAERGEKPITAPCKEYGSAENTFYIWRRGFGGLDVPEARQIKELESENARLTSMKPQAAPRRA